MAMLLWALVAVCVLWVTLSCLPAGWDGRVPVLPYLIALQPFLWIPMAVVCVAALCLGEMPAATGALVAAVLAVARRPLTNHTQRVSARESLERAEHATAQLTVMTLNCRYGRADARAIVRAVRERGITVLALEELDDALVAALEREGLRELLPHRCLGEGKESDNGGFNGIWTKDEPVATAADVASIPAADVPAAVLRAGGATVLLAAAHTKSPMRGPCDWSDGIRGLARLIVHTTPAAAADAAFDAVVVMGDLNADIDHPSFRTLLKAGFRDAGLAAASRRQPTFPRWLPWPRIVLDHVLFTDRLAVTRTAAFVVEGTDHLALTATLAV
ncbi:endonuclease/exonuclease/phosphatase family protein [Bifidobacterium pullorum subsp. saeculare]|uniref:Endonuclease/exonuclease/phosphatase family protein n=1 Tax=Bifidobacterium pullorum subsp. saeculare TaxID=78257 RepID=A0A938X051_9BIFI|nr:endonuclease/exonuclease/phosphatase family protein [Bifidobacterium pullorum]MBM6700238.1 endonuclease/exonuclease/phosphatase family protein [Bifidobacterium pullorum subsp. saeculare]